MNQFPRSLLAIATLVLVCPASFAQPSFDRTRRPSVHVTKTPSNVQSVSSVESELKHDKALIDQGLSMTTSEGLVMPINGHYALQLIQDIRKKPSNSEAWFGLGVVLSSASKHVEAEKAYRRGLSVNASDSAAWNNLGNALSAQGRLKEAEAAYVKSLQIGPFGSWLNIANVRKRLGDTKGEQEARNKAEESGENDKWRALDRFRKQIQQHPEPSSRRMTYRPL